MRLFWKKPVKNVKIIETEFKFLSIGLWGNTYEVEIKYQTNQGNERWVKKVEEKFSSLDEAVKFAVDYISTTNDKED